METREFNHLTVDGSRGERNFYVETPHVHIHLYNGSLSLTDLTNALKIGEICESYSMHYHGSSPLPGYHILRSVNYDLQVLMEIMKAIPWEKDRWGGWENISHVFNGMEVILYRSDIKGVRVYSPFALDRMKPLKEDPKKWTLRHALRALVNGQYESLRCTGVYTDDYAYDYAYNYQQGEIKNGKAFAKQIIESPSGWWVYESNGVVHISCHTFDNNEFKFKAA